MKTCPNCALVTTLDLLLVLPPAGADTALLRTASDSPTLPGVRRFKRLGIPLHYRGFLRCGRRARLARRAVVWGSCTGRQSGAGGGACARSCSIRARVAATTS